MRAVVVHPGASYAVADVYRGWIRGLIDCGVQVIPYNLDERLNYYEHARWVDDDGTVVKQMTFQEAATAACEGVRARCWDVAPDVVIVVCARFTPPELFDSIRARGVKVVIIHTESPYEDDWQIRNADRVDVNLLNDPACIDSWRAVNAETYYVPHAYDPTIHHPGPSDHKSDVCFVGTGWSNRVEFLERCDWSGIDFAIAGKWDRLDDGRPLLADDSPLRSHLFDGPISNAVTADLYRGSRIGFNVYRGESSRSDLAQGWALGPREVEMAACGLFQAREPRPEGDELFPFLPTFTDPAELREICDHYLTRDTERTELAERARAAVSGRTFASHAARLMARIDALA